MGTLRHNRQNQPVQKGIDWGEETAPGKAHRGRAPEKQTGTQQLGIQFLFEDQDFQCLQGVILP